MTKLLKYCLFFTPNWLTPPLNWFWLNHLLVWQSKLQLCIAMVFSSHVLQYEPMQFHRYYDIGTCIYLYNYRRWSWPMCSHCKQTYKQTNNPRRPTADPIPANCRHYPFDMLIKHELCLCTHANDIWIYRYIEIWIYMNMEYKYSSIVIHHSQYPSCSMEMQSWYTPTNSSSPWSEI